VCGVFISCVLSHSLAILPVYCYTESVHSVSELNEILWVYVNFDDFASEVKFAVLIQDLEF